MTCQEHEKLEGRYRQAIQVYTQAEVALQKGAVTMDYVEFGAAKKRVTVASQAKDALLKQLQRHEQEHRCQQREVRTFASATASSSSAI
jgi:hypothetical protein